jgi:hypothetical protein
MLNASHNLWLFLKIKLVIICTCFAVQKYICNMFFMYVDLEMQTVGSLSIQVTADD